MAEPRTDATTEDGPKNTVPAPPINDLVWDEAVSQWINTCVRSSPISHDVGAWNRLNEVLPRLRGYLNDALSKKE